MGILEDDGAERGLVFVAAMARIDRQLEFVKTWWISKGLFFGSPTKGSSGGTEHLYRPPGGGLSIHGWTTRHRMHRRTVRAALESAERRTSAHCSPSGHRTLEGLGGFSRLRTVGGLV